MRLVRFERAGGEGPVFVNPRSVASVRPHEWKDGRSLLTTNVRWADDSGWCDNDTYKLVEDAETVANSLNAAEVPA